MISIQFFPLKHSDPTINSNSSIRELQTYFTFQIKGTKLTTYIGRQNFKMSEGKARVANLSAQPKHNKCVLKPGRSLMDWIRLGLSGTDLSGTKGVIHPVSREELAKHCQLNDAWMSIRGMVFNVTHYMEFHPGGIDELMKGVGQDASKLFEDVHPWVNYGQMLAKCYVGPLTNDSKVCCNVSSTENDEKKAFFLAPGMSALQNRAAMESNSQIFLPERHSTVSEIQKLPYRFDWIQKLKEIILIFYTTSFSNPAVILRYLNSNSLEVDIIIKNITYEFRFKLFEVILWPCLVKVYDESGKIEIICSKQKEILWPTYGESESKTNKNPGKVEYEFEKTHAKVISKNSFAVSVQPRLKMIMHTGIGNYVLVSAKSLDSQMARSYTPVPAIFAALEHYHQNICFLVKRYDTGNMSRFIVNEESRLFHLSEPKGDFPLSLLKDHSRIGLLAAGSGITPMLSIIHHLLGRSYNKVESIYLVYVNRTVADIWCYEELEERKLIDNRLRTKYFLTQPDKSCYEQYDNFSEETFATYLSVIEPSPPFFCVCGPKGFNETALSILEKKGLCLSNIYCFQ